MMQTHAMPSLSPLEPGGGCMVLVVIDGPDAGRSLRLQGQNLYIGCASENHLVLTDPTVSRRHAELCTTEHGLMLRDLGSTNGTFCDGVRVTEAYLRPGMSCSLGATELRLKLEAASTRSCAGGHDGLGDLVGASAPMRELYGLLEAIAPSAATVLISGESGSGKEAVARTLHGLSGRAGPLVVFDASVTDPEMVRNDLFGHVKGAFTGAAGARDGAFRRAQGGTLFIDEIGELPLELQPRLLRVLESREVLPVGSDRPVKVDVRVLAATHRDLEAMVAAGTFRADLYYRLSVVRVRVPALRDMPDDIAPLAEHLARGLGLRARLSSAALDALGRYHWPGNVRELRNLLERAGVLCTGGWIGPEHLSLTPQTAPNEIAPTRRATPSTMQLKDVERQAIKDALARNAGNKAATARELGMSLSTLKRRISVYGL